MPDPISIGASALGALTGGIQAISNIGKAKRANEDLQRLFKQRKAFKTPKEVIENAEFTTWNAAQGYSDETMNYLTGQAGAGLSSSLGTASRLGADPNQLSSVLDSYYQNIFKIGNENELVKMKKFDSLTNALNLVAENKNAEWQSQENLIKDQMQAAAARLKNAETGINSGVNFATQSLSNLAASFLYDEDDPNQRKGRATSRAELLASNTAATVPPARRIG